MQVESLVELKAAFDDWRRRKRYSREPVPHELLERARRAIEVYGVGPVACATKIDRTRLRTGGTRRKIKNSAVRVPAYSRVDVAPPRIAAVPFAEVETVGGLKLRIFTQTAETLDLLSSLFGAGGMR